MKTNFRELWSSLSPDEKRSLAEKADTSVAYLSQVAHGHRRAGYKTIASLTGADERISLAMFFPDAA